MKLILLPQQPELRIDAAPDWEAYYTEHAACPECGNLSTMQTTAPRLYADMDQNQAMCGCGWEGRVHDLVAVAQKR